MRGSGFGGGGFSESLLVQTRAENAASMLRVDAASASLLANLQAHPLQRGDSKRAHREY